MASPIKTRLVVMPLPTGAAPAPAGMAGKNFNTELKGMNNLWVQSVVADDVNPAIPNPKTFDAMMEISKDGMKLFAFDPRDDARPLEEDNTLEVETVATADAIVKAKFEAQRSEHFATLNNNIVQLFMGFNRKLPGTNGLPVVFYDTGLPLPTPQNATNATVRIISQPVETLVLPIDKKVALPTMPLHTRGIDSALGVYVADGTTFVHLPKAKSSDANQGAEADFARMTPIYVDYIRNAKRSVMTVKTCFLGYLPVVLLDEEEETLVERARAFDAVRLHMPYTMFRDYTFMRISSVSGDTDSIMKRIEDATDASVHHLEPQPKDDRKAIYEAMIKFHSEVTRTGAIMERLVIANDGEMTLPTDDEMKRMVNIVLGHKPDVNDMALLDNHPFYLMAIEYTLRQRALLLVAKDTEAIEMVRTWLGFKSDSKWDQKILKMNDTRIAQFRDSYEKEMEENSDEDPDTRFLISNLPDIEKVVDTIAPAGFETLIASSIIFSDTQQADTVNTLMTIIKNLAFVNDPTNVAFLQQGGPPIHLSEPICQAIAEHWLYTHQYAWTPELLTWATLMPMALNRRIKNEYDPEVSRTEKIYIQKLRHPIFYAKTVNGINPKTDPDDFANALKKAPFDPHMYYDEIMTSLGVSFTSLLRDIRSRNPDKAIANSNELQCLPIWLRRCSYFDGVSIRVLRACYQSINPRPANGGKPDIIDLYRIPTSNKRFHTKDMPLDLEDGNDTEILANYGKLLANQNLSLKGSLDVWLKPLIEKSDIFGAQVAKNVQEPLARIVQEANEKIMALRLALDTYQVASFIGIEKKLQEAISIVTERALITSVILLHSVASNTNANLEDIEFISLFADVRDTTRAYMDAVVMNQPVTDDVLIAFKKMVEKALRREKTKDPTDSAAQASGEEEASSVDESLSDTKREQKLLRTKLKDTPKKAQIAKGILPTLSFESEMRMREKIAKFAEEKRPKRGPRVQEHFDQVLTQFQDEETVRKSRLRPGLSDERAILNLIGWSIGESSIGKAKQNIPGIRREAIEKLKLIENDLIKDLANKLEENYQETPPLSATASPKDSPQRRSRNKGNTEAIGTALRILELLSDKKLTGTKAYKEATDAVTKSYDQSVEEDEKDLMDSLGVSDLKAAGVTLTKPGVAQPIPVPSPATNPPISNPSNPPISTNPPISNPSNPPISTNPPISNPVGTTSLPNPAPRNPGVVTSPASLGGGSGGSADPSWPLNSPGSVNFGRPNPAPQQTQPTRMPFNFSSPPPQPTLIDPLANFPPQQNPQQQNPSFGQGFSFQSSPQASPQFNFSSPPPQPTLIDPLANLPPQQNPQQQSPSFGQGPSFQYSPQKPTQWFSSINQAPGQQQQQQQQNASASPRDAIYTQNLSLNDTISALNLQVSQLKRTIQDRDDTINELKETETRLRTEIVALDTALDDIDAKGINHQNDHILDLDNELKSLQTQLNYSNEHRDALMKELANTRDYGNKIAELVKANTALENEKANQMTVVTRLAREKKVFNDEVNDLKVKLTAAAAAAAPGGTAPGAAAPIVAPPAPIILSNMKEEAIISAHLSSKSLFVSVRPNSAFFNDASRPFKSWAVFASGQQRVAIGWESAPDVYSAIWTDPNYKYVSVRSTSSVLLYDRTRGLSMPAGPYISRLNARTLEREALLTTPLVIPLRGSLTYNFGDSINVTHGNNTLELDYDFSAATIDLTEISLANPIPGTASTLVVKIRLSNKDDVHKTAQIDEIVVAFCVQ